MQGQNPQGHTMPGTSHAQRALPDARRREHGTTHQYGLDPFKASQLETRLLFGTVETPGKVAAPVAA
jgi:hypothetical protein